MSLGVTDLKKGTSFQFENHPYKVIEYGQKVLGRGGSIVNVKIKSLLDGKVLEKTFKGSESFEPAEIITRSVQFLYADDKAGYFMDTESFENHELGRELVATELQYMKEGDSVQLQLYEASPIGIELPKNVWLKIEYAEDAVKGDTSSAITKDAKTETGMSVKVPSFIKTGDIISVDTTTGNYRERMKS